MGQKLAYGFDVNSLLLHVLPFIVAVVLIIVEQKSRNKVSQFCCSVLMIWMVFISSYFFLRMHKKEA